MALEHLRDISPQYLLIICAHSLDESTHKTQVSASVATAFILRVVRCLITRAEVGDSKIIHIANYLAVREV